MANSTVVQLTAMIISPSDLKRARRELESLDDFLHQAGLRRGGKAVMLPQASRLTDELAEEYKLNLLLAVDRQKLLKFLADLIQTAPVLHVSFASEPSAAFMSKLIAWFRSELHPQILVQIGLQPSITAGCIVRTANKQFDFSLTKAFDAQKELLLDGLKGPVIAANKPTDRPVSDVALETLKPDHLATAVVA